MQKDIFPQNLQINFLHVSLWSVMLDLNWQATDADTMLFEMLESDIWSALAEHITFCNALETPFKKVYFINFTI